MRRLPRTAAAFLALSGLACTVDRSGGGEQQAVGASAGGGPGVGIEAGGHGGSGAVVAPNGTAGVFGVAMGTAGGGSSGTNAQDHEGGASGAGGSPTVEPVDGGGIAVEAAGPKEADSPIEAPSVPTCATHPGGQNFTPNGAVSAHCYWPLTEKSNWQDAFDSCMGSGGHLATLTSGTESTFVLKLFPNLTSTDRVWLGGTDKKDEGDRSGGGPYQWTTGEPFSYAPWAMSNPDGACDSTCNGSPCHCQHRVCVDRGGVFWDRYEGDPNYAVCESEP